MSNFCKCIVCIQVTHSEGMLRGVCKHCQLSIFVAKHIERVSTAISLKHDLREDDLNRRESEIEEQEQGLQLVQLIKEIVN